MPTAIVTGASRGLGLALARALAGRGWRLVIDARVSGPLDEVAAEEPYAGWGGYGSAKAALDHLTAILAVEHHDLRIYSVDPGDMNTRLHQEAFPGADISDRPPPEESVPGLLELIEGTRPSGRYATSELRGARA